MTPTDSPLYDIIFRGDILPGQQLSEVKARLARLFKVEPEKINALFSGAAVPLKRNLDQVSAQKYRSVLQQAGADVQVAIAGTVQNRTAAPRKARAMTLQQRLAAQEAERERIAAGREAAASAGEEPPRFTLAPAGADLLDATERPQSEPVIVDVSNISLRPVGENLVDAGEQARALPVAMPVTDFGLSQPGEDLLQEHERKALPPVELTLPDIDLAPVGSDLGQLKGAPPPPPPDTSRLSLIPDPG